MSEFSKEVILVLLGAGIGLVSSLVIIIVERWLNQKGKLYIYYKLSNQKGVSQKSWGFFNNYNNSYSFIVPVTYEIQNTSNTTKVVRDVGLYLYNGNHMLGKMNQLDQLHITNRKGKEITSEIIGIFKDIIPEYLYKDLDYIANSYFVANMRQYVVMAFEEEGLIKPVNENRFVYNMFCWERK